MPSFSPASVLAFAGPDSARSVTVKAAPTAAAVGRLRIGIVCNPKSHLNHGAEYEAGVPGVDSVLLAAPGTRTALVDTLAEFAERKIDLLVIDGGDGTVRDVLTCAAHVWKGKWPDIAVIPSGKTNALAIDLGIPSGWTLADALAAVTRGRRVERRPVEIARDDGSRPLRGFLFGAGAFVKATELAQHTHRAGAFNGVAVGLALGWALIQTMFGGAKSSWRVGTPLDLKLPGGTVDSKPRYLLLASALRQLPLGLKPFGQPRDGMKLLVIDAPPKRLMLTVPALLAGSEADWMRRAGYHHIDTASFEVSLDDGFILDGEHFDGGKLAVRQGPVLSFIAP
ncbi:diacylglycerol/lipid kinase family protein [Sphingomonas sp. Leaf339]|uniref:diacylglycerol/lipid kinase family protein n=1 Tax=Sphingomonas sp. Leaf339 TaxID=1736343 RepID=UPI0009EB074E|nr:diacylglycerol kinase family protein [Sphingomonas sp. Leaf339]